MVILEPGEVVRRSGAVVWVGPRGPRSGTLTLTNHALLFDSAASPVAGTTGPGAGEVRIPLWRCRGASLVRGPRGGAALEVELLARRLVFRTDDIEGWAGAIREARATAPPAPPGAAAGVGGPGGARGALRRCDYCGHLSPSAVPKCATCGAPF